MTKPYPVTPLAGGRAGPRTAIELAKEHKEETANHGVAVGRQLAADVHRLEVIAAEVDGLGDYVLPGVRQIASDLMRELKVQRERLEAILSRGAA